MGDRADERGPRPSGAPGGYGDRAQRPARDAGGSRPDRPGRAAGAAGARRDSAGRPAVAGSRGPGARTGGTGGAPRGASRDEIAQRTYDPRREERRKATRVALPDDVDPRELDGDTRRELRTLSKDTSDLVARHLVMTGRLLDDEPEQALAHARAARALAGRVGVVREATGLAAYAAGEWAEALSELRAARRITGRPEHLGVFADCERALGRPERALAYGDDPQLAQMSQEQRVELVIVLAGARRDLGQHDAAVLALQDVARRTSAKHPWAARLWYAYADALLAAGREAQAAEWFARTAATDVEGETDAGDRLLALEGVVLEGFDTEGFDTEDEPAAELPSDEELAEYGRTIAPPRDRTEADADPAADQAPAPLASAVPPAPSGVAPPVFVEAPGPTEDEDDLRLFD